jgi:hypothetical protein
LFYAAIHFPTPAFPPSVTPIRFEKWHDLILNEASTAFVAPADQPSTEKSPIERGEPLDILGHLPAANDNELVWPFIPFPENLLV